MPKLTETQIRAIAEAARNELGESATYERLHQVVSRVVEQMENQPEKPASAASHLLIICLSRDNRKNAEALSGGLKDTGCRIEDRAERIMGSFHVLLASVDTVSGGCETKDLKHRLAEAGSKAGVKVIVQREDILRSAP
jgi:predicted amino acid-binding ACT domain protein